jgi:hypothetical protein
VATGGRIYGLFKGKRVEAGYTGMRLAGRRSLGARISEAWAIEV